MQARLLGQKLVPYKPCNGNSVTLHRADEVFQALGPSLYQAAVDVAREEPGPVPTWPNQEPSYSVVPGFAGAVSENECRLLAEHPK